MRTRRYLIAAFAVSAAVSCVKENIKESQPSQAEGLMEKTFEAYAPTRTALGADGMSVIWSENDGINVFDETSAKYEAFSVTTAGEASTKFKGMADASATDFYALYPYNADATWDYDTRTLTSYLTHKQKGIAGGFDASAALSVASESDGVLNFSNVGSLMRFSITSSDVKEIIIKANNAEKLAGAVTVKFDEDGNPSIDTEALGTMWHKVQLLPAQGDVFSPGVYNIVVLPCTLKDGLTVNVTRTDNKVYSKAKKDEAVIAQGRVFELGAIDADLAYDRDKYQANMPSGASLLYTSQQFASIKSSTGASVVEALGYAKSRGSDGAKLDVEGVADETKATTDIGTFYDKVSDISLVTLHMFTFGNTGESNDRKALYPKIIDLVYDWAMACSNVEYVQSENIGGHLTRGCYPFFVVFELLKGTTFSTSEIDAAIEAWFRKMANDIKGSIKSWQDNNYYNSQYFQNHVAAHMWGLMSIGYAIDDPSLVEFALDHIDNPRDFYDCLQGCILMEGDTPCLRDPDSVAPKTGEIMDRYRHSTNTNKGLQYTSLTLQILSSAARTMRNNGLNLYDYTCPTGENLKLAYEFYAPIYAADDASLQGGYYTGEDGRIGIGGDLHGLFELGYNAYPNSTAIKAVIDAIPNRASNEKSVTGGKNATIRQMHQQLGYTRFLSIDVDKTN